MLTELIEQFARFHLLAFIQAGKISCKDPRSRNQIADALGGWYKGRVPNDRTIQRWKDADNAFMALRRPDVDREGLTQDQLEYRLAPYLKRSQKTRPIPGRYKQLLAKAEDHFARGCSRADLVRVLGIAKSTIYRWFQKNLIEHPS